LFYKEHREVQVRRTVIELMPTMAQYNNTVFVTDYLHKCMMFLLGQLKRDRDRATCA
jgi:FKBP12-rapamycin complex-associated protein